MTDPLRLAILHCHGSGNDFPLVDARGLDVAEAAWPAIARALADRAGPVGGDGLLLLTAGDETHAFGMRMFNSDGSESEQCLNGLRCVARAGLAATGLARARVKLLTSSAEVWTEAELAPGVVTIGERAGPVGLDVRAWPMGVEAAGIAVDADGRLIDAPVPPLDPERRFTAVAMPNPHLVAFVDAVDEAELVRLGEACEAAPDWLPRRANVSFVEVRGPDALFVRTFERGVGLTDSCGSAMAASTVAAALTGRAAWDAPVTVWNRGGRVRAAAGRDGTATLGGNATWEWAGEVNVDAERGGASGLVVTERFGEELAAWEEARGSLSKEAGASARSEA